jgi:uncharacterized protein YciI
MATHAVVYTYVDDPARLDEVRPEHREFLAGLHEEGFLIASGPLTGGSGASALLLVEAAAPEVVESLLENDPFRREGLIADRDVQGWDVVIGDLG